MIYVRDTYILSVKRLNQKKLGKLWCQRSKNKEGVENNEYASAIVKLSTKMKLNCQNCGGGGQTY